MSIASRVKWFLEVNRAKYEVIVQRSPEAGIPSDKMAKAVLLEDERGYVMPVLSASSRLDIDKLNRKLQRELQPASENDVTKLFFDCESGAIPPVGSAYGVPTIIDDHLLELGDIYFEGGDRVDLVHMDGEEFFSLSPDASHADLVM